MPPATGSAAACPAPPSHCPSELTRSAAVTGRSSNSFLPPEKVAQSGLRSNVSGLGTSVTPLRLRSDEHADIAHASVAIAIMRSTIWSVVASLRSCLDNRPRPTRPAAEIVRQHHDLDQ